MTSTLYPMTVALTDDQRDAFTAELRAFADDDLIRAAAVKSDTFCPSAAFYAKIADDLEATGELTLVDQGHHEDVCTIFWAQGWLQPDTTAPQSLRDLGELLFEDAVSVS